MLKRIVIITFLIGLAVVIGGASCSPPATSMPTLIISPVLSPTDIPLTETPISHPTVALTNAPSLPPQNTCLWTPYNNVSNSTISSGCLNDLSDIGVSGDIKQISFFVDEMAVGMYGICQDISEKGKIEFKVTIRDNIASARFLVTIGPAPIPIKALSRAFSIQPEGSDEMYVKFIKYVSTSEAENYPMEIGKIQAIPYWKQDRDWNFDFAFEFSNSKVSMSMNKALAEHWQLNSPSRYLCFVYQAMPTATQPTELEAQVIFP